MMDKRHPAYRRLSVRHPFGRGGSGYVQGESLKAGAASSEAFQLPDLEPGRYQMRRIIDFLLGRHRNWRMGPDGVRARRWTGEAWEYRPATQDDKDDELSTLAW